MNPGLYGLALAAAFFSSFLSLPVWRYWCRKIGLMDDPGHRKIHSAPIALAGGLAVMTGLLLPVILGYFTLPLFEQTHRFMLHHGYEKRGIQLIILFIGAVTMMVIGLLDDKYELQPAIKFLGQLLVAFFTAAAGIRITLFVPNIYFSYFITILWILTLTNAFNFMDNMNGLCGGLGMIGAWYFAWNAAIQGQYLVTILAALSCGAILGFLPYNFPVASVFLGDAGSHLIGYLLATMGILPHFYTPENPRTWAVLSPLLILAIPLIDLAWVVLIRWKLKKPFYVGDNNHLSHRLTRKGWTRTSAVLWIWLFASISGACSFFLP